MNIIYKLSRFWIVLCPVALLAVFFKYIYLLQSIINAIEGMSFKRTIVILVIAFFALWSFFHLSAVYFVRLMRWVWMGTTPTPVKNLDAKVKKELQQPLKSNIEEREELFKLDLKSESAA